MVHWRHIQLFNRTGRCFGLALQIANMTALIANGGKLMEPHVVHSLIDPVTKETNAQR